jgi:hypothetical protein
MSAPIEFVCHAAHAARARVEIAPTITVHQGRWAYCAKGGAAGHEWEPTEAQPIEAIRLGASLRLVATDPAKARS